MPSPAEVVAEERSRAESLADTFIAELQAALTALSNDIISEPAIDVQFSAVEEPALLTADTLRAALEARLAGGTGLSPEVEAGIWDRSREREAVLAQAQVDEATLQDEALGFDFPTGALQGRLEVVSQEYFNKVSGLSRDIAIKQADLEQQNLKDAQAGLVQLYQTLATEEVEHWRALISQNDATRNYVLAASKLNSDILLSGRTARLDAAKVQAQVLAQLCAAAIGRVNVSAGVTATGGTTVQYAYSNNTSSTVPPITDI